MNEKSNSGEAMAKAITELVGGKAALDYFTFVSDELGFIYFSCPCVANVRTAGSLNLATAEALNLDYEISNMKFVLQRKFGILNNPRQLGYEQFGRLLDNPTVIKFTFVRDPIARFAAIYRNSFAADRIKNKVREKLFTHLGLPADDPLSMLDLAELVCEEAELKSLFPQLRSQRQMTAFDLVEYDFIGKHENWKADYSAVTAEIFGSQPKLFDPIEAFNNDPEGQKVRVLVNDETQAVLREAYQEDFAMIEEVAELYPQGFAS